MGASVYLLLGHVGVYFRPTGNRFQILPCEKSRYRASDAIGCFNVKIFLIRFKSTGLTASPT